MLGEGYMITEDYSVMCCCTFCFFSWFIEYLHWITDTVCGSML